jgi:hypothetical protein
MNRYCPIIKFGTTRIVILFLKWAIKIPNFFAWNLFLLGLLANRQEIIFSRTKWDCLCPIVAHIPGGWIVIMKRAIELTEDEFYVFVASGCLSTECVIPIEIKRCSFGWVEGRIVAVDYGN